MNDFLEYVKLDPYFRKGAHNLMTFAMTYAYSENYILGTFSRRGRSSEMFDV